MARVSEALARPARTVVQGTPAWIITELLDSYGWVPMDERQYGATVLALTVIIGWAQTLVENRLGKALFRQVPPTTAPVVDDTSSGSSA